MGCSLLHCLPSFLIFFGFLLYTSIQSPITTCPSFDCGYDNKISYPFWHQSQQFEHCGYPGFNLSCNDQNLMLQLSNDDFYHIKEINYSNNSLTLAYPVSLKEATCPKLIHDVKINTTISLFNTSGNKLMHFFYNCTLYPPSLPHIGCLKYGAKSSFVFEEGAIPEFDWHRYCESTVTVPVIDKAMDGDLVQGFGQALKGGFKLTWKQQDGVCQLCEASGGFCSYSDGISNNFFCICKNGRHLINCQDSDISSGKGAVSIPQELNYVAIGALLFGGLVIIATVFYFFQKKKIGSYKPV